MLTAGPEIDEVVGGAAASCGAGVPVPDDVPWVVADVVPDDVPWVVLDDAPGMLSTARLVEVG
ncbi:MAG: hypothetical protein JJE50_07315 [Actinomycetales bacterium]|nr:hypothetical protein [Actinomycetales bacterium]